MPTDHTGSTAGKKGELNELINQSKAKLQNIKSQITDTNNTKSKYVPLPKEFNKTSDSITTALEDVPEHLVATFQKVFSKVCSRWVLILYDTFWFWLWHRRGWMHRVFVTALYKACQ